MSFESGHVTVQRLAEFLGLPQELPIRGITLRTRVWGCLRSCRCGGSR
jgi:hypothetical protein